MSGRGSLDDAPCPVGRAIGVLQEKWVLHIVHALLDGPRGFNDLGRAVGGCNPTTLTQRLALLEDVGLVVRSDDHGGRGRSAYRLTAAGEGLSQVIDAIHAWSLQHLHSAAPLAPTLLPARISAPSRDGDLASPIDADPLAAG